MPHFTGLCIIAFLLQVEGQTLRQQKDTDSLYCGGLGANPQSLQICLHLNLSHVPWELSPKNMGGWPEFFRCFWAQSSEPVVCL